MQFRKTISILSVCFLLQCSSAALAGKIPDTGDPNEPVCNPRSYTNLGNGIIKDNVTGLMWQQATAPGTYSLNQAKTYCNGLSLGGYTNWRLPTIKELSALVDSSSTSGPTINTTYFPDTVASDHYYLSSTPAGAFFLDVIWCVDFFIGKTVMNVDPGVDLYVRAVRGGSLTNSFVDNGDGTITDTRNGLMWEKLNSAPTATWDQAKAYCENLTLGGQSDWRLPNRNELRSLVDYSRNNPAINTTFFPDAVADDYWSSTTDVFSSGAAWVVEFGVGSDFHDRKTDNNYIRAVRGGCALSGSSTTTSVSGGDETTPATTTVPFSTTTTSVWTDGTCPLTKVLGGDNPKLENLRTFRDSTLAQSALGRKLIQIYYNNADSINAALDRKPALRTVARRVLEVIAPMVGNQD